MNKRNIFIVFFLCVLSGNIYGQTLDWESRHDLQKLYEQVRMVVRQYYPEATAHLLKNRIYFEFHTRIFIVHEPLKTGEWQDPWEERGPMPKGIMGVIELRPGSWQGQAILPQSFDKRYFTEHVSALYSQKLDAHLYIIIKVPRIFPKEFYDKLMGVSNRFDEYVNKAQFYQ